MSKNREYFCIVLFILSIAIISSTLIETPFGSSNVPTLMVSKDTTFIEDTDAIELSNYIVKAEFLSANTKENYTLLNFRVIESLKGNLQKEQEIGVYQYPENSTGESPNEYKCNNIYFLGLNKRISVYYPEERYTILKDFSDSDSQGLNTQSVDLQNLENLSIDSTKNENGFIGVKPVSAKNLTELAQKCPYIYKIEIGPVLVEGIYSDVTTYKCKILQVYKGETIDHEVYVVFFNNTVKTGDTLLAFLNRAGDDSYVFTLASKENSLFPVSREEYVIHAIKGEIEK